MGLRPGRRARRALATSLVAASSAGCAEIGGFQFIPEPGTGPGAFSGPGYTCQWVTSFGDAEATLGGIAVDGDDTVWVAGGFKGRLTIPGGTSLRADGAGKDVFVAHLARDGNHLWSERFGNAANDSGTHVHQATSIALGGDSVYVAGDFTGSLSFGADCGPPAGAEDGAAFVARLDKVDPGEIAACAAQGARGQDEAKAVAVDGGRVVVLTSLDGGKEMGLTSYDGQSLASPCSGSFRALGRSRFLPGALRASSGNTFVASAFEGRVDVGFPAAAADGVLPPGSAPADGIDSFLVSLPTGWICDGAGGEDAVPWSRHYAAVPGDQRAGALALTGDDLVLAGSFEGGIDLAGEPAGALASADQDGFVASLDRRGGLVWAKQLGGGAAQSVEAVGIDGDGNVVVGGHFRQQVTIDAAAVGGAAGDDDIFLARLGRGDGKVDWLGGLGGPEHQALRALVVSDDDVFLAGTSSADFELLNCPISAADGRMFVAKLSVSSSR